MYKFLWNNHKKNKLIQINKHVLISYIYPDIWSEQTSKYEKTVLCYNFAVFGKLKILFLSFIDWLTLSFVEFVLAMSNVKVDVLF